MIRNLCGLKQNEKAGLVTGSIKYFLLLLPRKDQLSTDLTSGIGSGV